MEEEVVKIEDEAEAEDDITTMADQLDKIVEKEAIQQCFAIIGLTGHMLNIIRIILLIILTLFSSHPLSIKEVVRHIFKEEMHLNFKHKSISPLHILLLLKLCVIQHGMLTMVPQIM
ncbi:hypothetical protein ACOSP7_017461 [Xanthoceras sorbifolium]